MLIKSLCPSSLISLDSYVDISSNNNYRTKKRRIINKKGIKNVETDQENFHLLHRTYKLFYP